MTYLLFVDDALFFYDGSLREASKLREILNLYNTTTNKEIDMFKSLIYFNVIDKAQEKLLLQ